MGKHITPERFGDILTAVTPGYQFVCECSYKDREFKIEIKSTMWNAFADSLPRTSTSSASAITAWSCTQTPRAGKYRATSARDQNIKE